ncbi:DUF2065 domain-containing protein [Burkholderiales bacterium]|nr:DUF2065 domain-containing protein [Burkholderiales bacterium]MDA9993973.1 DUF2065 domain-containing protein [Burkholderiales bacterium]MDC0500712.1 DUF2065 domain-containing protein [Burkholderiales bacterium]
MAASDVAVALALVLILEGMLPFLSPSAWRDAFKKLVKMSDGQLRFFGLTSMVMGLIALLILS